jgi:GTP-binding protein
LPPRCGGRYTYLTNLDEDDGMAGRVAIVGRPNVGKSALFNRLVGRRVAIVDQVAGITRDRIGAEAEWRGVRFALTDTGGIMPAPDEPLVEQVRLQAEVAIAESDIVLLVCDVRDGVTPLDEEVAALLRPAASRVLCVANKCDNDRQHELRHEFARFGFGDVYGVSALHGLRVGPLLDEVVGRLPVESEAPGEQPAVRVAIVGKPNVGKSSFVNALLREKRLVVDASPGTTRDAVDVAYRGPHGERFVLIDTAGIKRKKSTRIAVEKYSAIRSEEAIARCDVTILMVDASAGVTTTDAKIAHLVEQHAKGCVIAVNKWDLVAAPRRGVRDEAQAGGTPAGFVQPARSAGMRQKDYTPQLFDRLRFLTHCPVLYTVATKGTNVGRALGRARKVFEAGAVRIGTGRLNEVIEKAVRGYQPPVVGNRRLKIYYATQTGVNPPTFLLFVNDPKLAKSSYRAYLINRIRQAEPYEGNPVVLRLRRR